MTILLLCGGLALLTAGAELLVKGAASLALALRIPSVVVGLTVVAFGTSAPEMVVSVQAGLSGQPEIALGNVVGSNIFNVLFILGVSALIVPLVVAVKIIWIDVPVMIGISALTLGLAWDGSISRPEGAALFLGLIGYTLWTVYEAKRERLDGTPPENVPPFTLKNLAGNAVLVTAGLALLVFGSRMFSDGAITIARFWGLSELVIGLTIVAAGTSLPEVATSIMAALRGERDIAVGNVVGSNVFNILGVLGMTCLVSPTGMPIPPQALTFDIPVMLVTAVACLPLFWTGHRIARPEGALFLVYFVIYTAYLILSASQAPSTELLRMMVWGFAVPLTLVTIGVSVWRHARIVQRTDDTQVRSES